MTDDDTLRVLFRRLVNDGVIAVYATQSGPPGTPPGALHVLKAGAKVGLTMQEVKVLRSV